MAELITLARPYAKAAFAQARAEERLAGWHEALALGAAIAADASVRRHVLGNPLVPAKEAAEFFNESGGERFDTGVQNFIRLLAENRRLSLLPHMAALFARYRAEAEQTLEVDVRASVALSEAQRARMEKALEKRFGRKVTLDVNVDASLLGGAVIRAGDTVIDASLRSRLARLETVLAR